MCCGTVDGEAHMARNAVAPGAECGPQLPVSVERGPQLHSHKELSTRRGEREHGRGCFPSAARAGLDFSLENPWAENAVLAF